MVYAAYCFVQGAQNCGDYLTHLDNQSVDIAEHPVDDIAYRQNLLGYAVDGCLNLCDRNIQCLGKLVHIAVKAINHLL